MDINVWFTRIVSLFVATLVNTEKETGAKLIVGLSKKRQYSIDAGLIHEKKENKTSFKVVPSLIIRMPDYTPVSITGDLNYKKGKSLMGSAMVDIKALTKKPVAVKCSLNAFSKRYTGAFSVSSKYLEAKVSGNVITKKDGATSKLIVDYDLPKHKNIKRNKITLSWKLKNKSTSSLYKYLVNANMVVKKNPELNFQADLDMSHNRKKHTGMNLEVNYGKNVKDLKKTVTVSANVNHAIKSKSASIDYKATVKYPAQGTNIKLDGKHKHDSKSLDSSHTITYGKGKKIGTVLILKDNSKRLKKLSGMLKLNYPGRTISLDSDLNQKSNNQYKHTINAKCGKHKATIATVYTTSNHGTSHKFTSDIMLPNVTLTRITGTTNFNVTDFKASGNVLYGKDEYGLKTSYQYNAGSNGRLTLDVKSPSHKIGLEIVGEKNDSEYSSKLDAKLDSKKIRFAGRIDIPSVDNIDSSFVLNYPSQSLQFNMRHSKDGPYATHADFSWSKGKRITLDTTFDMKNSPRIRNAEATFKFRSTFKKLRDMDASFVIENNNGKYLTESKLSWDGKRKQIDSSINILKPISAKNLHLTFTAKTPFKDIGRLQFVINHALTNKINTEITASVDKTNAALRISAENRGDTLKRDLDGSISFKSNIRQIPSIELQMRHEDDWSKYDTCVNLGINEQRYTYKLNMNHQNRGFQIINNGKLELTAGRYFSVQNTWTHHNTEKAIKTFITSEWGNRKRIRFDMSGDHAVSTRIKTVGSLNLETPWAPLRVVNININNNVGKGFIGHQMHYVHDGISKISTNVTYVRSPHQIEFDFMITTPWTNDMSGKVNTRYRQNPMTGHAEFQLSPNTKLTADGSLSAISVTNIDGSLRITTPYNGFESIFINAAQKKKGSELITTGGVEYGDRKSIEFESRIQTENAIKIFGKVETPFTEYRLMQTGFEFSGNLHDFNTRTEFTASPIVGTFKGSLNWKYMPNMIGKLRIDTPLERFPYFQLSASSEESRKQRCSKIEIEYSPEKTITIDTKYKFQGMINIEAIVQTPFKDARRMKASFKHLLGHHSIQTSAKAEFGTYHPLQASFNLKWVDNIDGTLSLKTPLKSFESSKIVIHHQGITTDFTSSCIVKLNKEKLIIVDVDFLHNDITEGTLVVSSSRFNDVKLTMTKKGNLENFKGSASLTYGDAQTIKAALQNSKSQRRLQSSVSIETPLTDIIAITLDHNGQLKNFTTKISGSIGEEYTIANELKFFFSDRLIQASNILNLKIYDQRKIIGLSFNKDGRQADWVANINGNVNEKHVSIVAHVTCTDHINGSLNVQTPFEHYRDVGLSFNHVGNRNKFKSGGTIRYKDGNTIEGKADIFSSSLTNFRGKLTAKTPFKGYTKTSFEHSHRLVDSDLAMNTKIVLPDSPVMSSVVRIKIVGPKAEIQMDANTNIDRLKKISLTMKKSGDINDFTGDFYCMMGDQVFQGDVRHRNIKGNIATKITMMNPFTPNIDFNFEHNVRSGGCSTSLLASLGTDTKAEAQLNFQKEDTKLTLTCNAEYTFDGNSDKATFSFKKVGTVSNADVKIVGSINEKTIDIHSLFQSENEIHGEVTVKTPFEFYKNIGLLFDHSGLINNFSCKVVLRYMEGKQISATLDHSHESWHIVDNKAELKTPFNGYKVVTVDYSHNIGNQKCNCDINIHYGEGNEIVGKIRASLSPHPQFEITMTTPYMGFKHWSAKGHFETMIMKYELLAEIIGIYGTTCSINSLVDMSGIPYTASVNIRTPVKQFETVKLSITHQGSPTDFKSTAMFKTPYTDSINGEVSLRYISPYVLEGGVFLNSSIESMRNLKLTVKNSNVHSTRNSQFRSYTELIWAPEKRITLDGQYKYHNDWNSKVVTYDAVISTPFEIAKQGLIKFEGTIGSDRYVHKVEVEHNNKSMLDMDMEYSKTSRHEGSVTIRTPRPMQFTVSRLIAGKSVEGDLMLNWNKEDPNSNVRFETVYGNKEGKLDKDIQIKMIRPAQTLVFSGSVKATRRHTSSRAELSWSEDASQKLSYDFSFKDNSRRYNNMYDSRIKISIPGRSLQLTGSFGGNHKAKTIDGNFFWDADQDQEKAVGMKATFQPSDRRADITLSLPAIGKDIRIGTEMTLNEGRILFNGKTEFSYSHDTRKTLTFLSRLEDISHGYESKNYSLIIGITHPYTDLDCRLSSNIGQSREKYSAGMDISYLTARRENKNLALRAEIDRLRNQINLEVISPERKIELNGEVVNTNPLQLRLRNRYNDQLDITSDLTIDVERKSLDFQSNYDLENLKKSIRLYAEYINSSAIEAQVFHLLSFQEHKEGLFAIRLNTSRLLHTRIHWRPEVITEIQDYLIKTLTKYGKAIDSRTQGMVSAIGDEIDARYHRTVTHVSAEIKPLRELLNKEMAVIGKQLETVGKQLKTGEKELRSMYSRNDYYILDMGNSVAVAINTYHDLVTRYKNMCVAIKRELTEMTEEIKSFPIKQKYFAMIKDFSDDMQKALLSGVEIGIEWINTLDENLRNMRNSMEHQKIKIQNSVTGYIDAIKNTEYGHYINILSDKLKEGIKSTKIAGQYNSVIYNARELVNAHLADIITQDEIDHIRGMANNVYQEGVWAYNYWKVEENAKKQLAEILTLITEMVMEEIENNTPLLKLFTKSKITVYDPEHGEIQLETYLPIPLRSLDRIPNVLPIVKAYNRYVPDFHTLKKLYDYVPRMFKRIPNGTVDNADFDTQFKQYLKSNSPMRPFGRKSYYAKRLPN